MSSLLSRFSLSPPSFPSSLCLSHVLSPSSRSSSPLSSSLSVYSLPVRPNYLEVFLPGCWPHKEAFISVLLYGGNTSKGAGFIQCLLRGRSPSLCHTMTTFRVSFWRGVPLKNPYSGCFLWKKLPFNNQTGENTALLSVDSKGDSACFLTEAFKTLLLKWSAPGALNHLVQIRDNKSGHVATISSSSQCCKCLTEVNVINQRRELERDDHMNPKQPLWMSKALDELWIWAIRRHGSALEKTLKGKKTTPDVAARHSFNRRSCSVETLRQQAPKLWSRATILKPASIVLNCKNAKCCWDPRSSEWLTSCVFLCTPW